MNEEYIIKLGTELADRCNTAMLGTNGSDGHPNIKAMLKMENEGLKTVWLSTNTASRRVEQLRKDSRACIYFVDLEKRIGLMLTGHVEILNDEEARKRIWREGFERYYPQGINDPDYTVLRFTANKGNYYHRGMNTDFEI